MSHYAEIGDDNIVLRVIVCEDDVISQFPGRWIQTSYNATIRKCFAGIGTVYDPATDCFKPPQPDPRMVFDDVKWEWRFPQIPITEL